MLPVPDMLKHLPQFLIAGFRKKHRLYETIRRSQREGTTYLLTERGHVTAAVIPVKDLMELQRYRAEQAQAKTAVPA